MDHQTISEEDKDQDPYGDLLEEDSLLPAEGKQRRSQGGPQQRQNRRAKPALSVLEFNDNGIT